ncbi:hypothetical protein Pve01_61740 [Planomonospora venezuelensis]|nr:hypothetical protein Pve01_61740 [Planomonospora venezuelensis]
MTTSAAISGQLSPNTVISYGLNAKVSAPGRIPERFQTNAPNRKHAPKASFRRAVV